MAEIRERNDRMSADADELREDRARPRDTPCAEHRHVLVPEQPPDRLALRRVLRHV